MRRRRRGQSTVELALAAPFIFLLFALTLQGGLVVSDQVQLEHFAYEGGQWAYAHRGDSTVDNAAVQNHVIAQMCGGSTSIPTGVTGASRFCTAEPAGISNLNVSVSTAAEPVADRAWSPIVTAEAAGGCKTWALAVTPATQLGDPTATPPDTLTYTIRLVSIGASGTDVDVNLAIGHYPGTLASVPVINPGALNTAAGRAHQATVKIALRSDTVSGTYNMSFTAYDSCPSTQVFASYANLVVKPSLPAVPPAGNLSVDGVIASALPIYICVAADLDISGSNFQPGATVKVGRDLAPSVTYVGTNELIAHFTSMPSAGTAGVKQDLTVTNPDGTSTTMVNAVTVEPGPCTSAVTTDPCVSGCGGGPGGGGCVGKCKEPNCVTACTHSGCLTDCQQPTCIANCKNATCTSNCKDPSCLRACDQTGCLSNCDMSSCVSYCKTSCTSGCVLPINCVDHCSTGTPPTTYNGCAGGAGQYLLTVTITWNEPLIIPWLTGSGTPYVPLRAQQKIVCQ